MDGISTSIKLILKQVIQNFNTLLDCPVRFSGEYDGRNVRNFIEYIEYYKRIKCITDEQALQELQHLLIDQAYIWWLETKENLSQWSEALSRLEYQYSSKQQPTQMVLNDINAAIRSETTLVELPVTELPVTELPVTVQEVSVEENDQVDCKPELCTSDVAPVMPLLEKDQVDHRCEPTIVQEVQKPSQELQSTYKGTLRAKDFYNAANIPESVINQLLPMIDEARVRTSSRKRVNLILQVPNAERYRVVLRKSGRHAIKPVISKEDNPRNEAKNNKDQEEPHKKQQYQNIIENTVVNNEVNTEIVHANEREPIIKVRRTEDLMPEVIDVEKIAETEIKQEEFISEDVKTMINSSQNSDENFQIDSDIMSQINNIIDESEMNMETEEENQHITTILPELPDNGSAIAYLYNGETTIQTENLKSHSTIKKSKRCSFCRHKGHSYETCLKKARKIKLIPERVKISDLLKDTEMNCSKLINTDNDKTSSTPKISLINTQSLLSNSPTTCNTTNSISSILNNIPDKCINTLLTTKLIEPIGGPSSSKVVAAKLRNTNVSMPKCHQCGTVGFYKSICPKCSPIYNNPNKQ